MILRFVCMTQIHHLACYLLQKLIKSQAGCFNYCMNCGLKRIAKNSLSQMIASSRSSWTSYQFPLKKEYIIYWIFTEWLPKSIKNQWEGRRGEGFFLLCFLPTISLCASFLGTFMSLQLGMIVTHKFPECPSQESYIRKIKNGYTGISYTGI